LIAGQTQVRKRKVFWCLKTVFLDAKERRTKERATWKYLVWISNFKCVSCAQMIPISNGFVV
jgi:uncharacterized protein affecting Mg2+/Co2+ transport